jgi:hypothetical protein
LQAVTGRARRLQAGGFFSYLLVMSIDVLRAQTTKQRRLFVYRHLIDKKPAA